MINSSFGDTNGDSTYISTRNSRLIYSPRFPDRGRGIPTISSGIIQALSIEEIESYMVEKLKIQSMYAVVENTPEGEGPLEEEAAFRRSVTTANTLSGFTPLSDQNGNNNSSQGLRVINSPAIKYIACQGGDIKFPAASITEKETSDFITRLEKGVLSTLGVPHALLFSPDEVSGKMNSSVVEVFNGSIKKRQLLLDQHANFFVSWAISKAIQNGDLPPNNDELLSSVFEFSHPKPFSIDDSKQNQDDIAGYQAGIKSLSEICIKRNTTYEELLSQIEKEQINFFKSAQRISGETNIPLDVVLNSMKETITSKINNNKE